MVTSSDPNYPKGFRDNQGIEPEPRVGIAWDIAGDGRRRSTRAPGCTTTRTSTRTAWTRWRGILPRRTRRASSTARWTRCWPSGPQGAFSNRPSAVFGIERDAKTPKSYNYSAGIQRELGWGTVLDVTYAGFQMRTARWRPTSTSCRTGPGSSTSTRRTGIRRRRPRRSPTSSCGRTWATRTSRSARTSARAHYNSLQVQLNRRYIHGLQFAVAYTLAQDDQPGPNRIRQPTFRTGPVMRGTCRRRIDAAPQPRRELHLGRAERQQAVGQLAHARRARRLAALRRHRSSSAATGRERARRRRTTSTSPAATRGTRPRINGDVLCSSGDNCDPTPGNPGSYLNVAAFSRLTGRGDYGNAPRTFFRLPKIVNSNISLFKNFAIGGAKRIQFRWEMYNVFNQVNWSSHQHERAVQSRRVSRSTLTSARRRPRAIRVSCRQRFGLRSKSATANLSSSTG